QVALFDQQPRSGGGDRLGRREDDVQGVVRRRRLASPVRYATEAAHGSDLAVPGHRDLRGREQTFAHFLFCAREERVECRGVDAERLRRLGEELNLRLGVLPLVSAAYLKSNSNRQKIS